MPNLKQSLTTLALLAVIIINGWHLAIVQLYAWSSMAWSNSQTMEISPAIIKALDGREMCGICEFVIEKKSDENTNSFAYWQVMTKILVVFIFARSILPQRPKYSVSTVSEQRSFRQCISEFPTPPPRFALS